MIELAFVDPVRGWGIRGDTFECLHALGRLGLPTWFQLGDRDLATHLLRSTWLARGRTLSAATTALAERFGLRVRLLPMSDDAVRTFIHTGAGRLAFQDYLVRRREIVLDDLYRRGGIYEYTRGYHWRGLVALLAGIAPNVPGFLGEIGVVADTAPVWRQVYTYAWFVGFAVSALLYAFAVRPPRAASR